MTRVVEGLPVSIQVRLARHARVIGMDPNLVLARFGLERFLYRLSRSDHADRFVLKGALMMLVWLGETLRPTRDADLLGFGDLSGRSLTSIFEEVCVIAVEPDGLTFLPTSIRVAPIRPEDAYGGMRATLEGHLGKARLRVQLDLGEANSRMRDFFDVFALAERCRFEGRPLAEAIRATFERRRNGDSHRAAPGAHGGLRGNRGQACAVGRIRSQEPHRDRAGRSEIGHSRHRRLRRPRTRRFGARRCIHRDLAAGRTVAMSALTASRNSAPPSSPLL